MIEARFTLLEVHCDYPGCDRTATDMKTSLLRDGWYVNEFDNKTFCLKHRLARHVEQPTPPTNGPHVKRSINGKFGYHD